MMRPSTQSGSMHAISAIVVALIFILALVFLFWQNFLQKPTESTETNHSPASVASGAHSTTKPADTSIITYEPVVEIAHKSDTEKLSGASASFKLFIADQLAKYNDPSTAGDCETSIVVSKIYKQSFAAGSFRGGGSASGCMGGTAVLFATKDGSWVTVATTRYGGFDCTKLENYKVPSVIAGDQCADYTATSGDGLKAYSQE